MDCKYESEFNTNRQGKCKGIDILYVSSFLWVKTMDWIESANKEFNYPGRYSQEYQNVELYYETLLHPQSIDVSVDIVRDEHQN